MGVLIIQIICNIVGLDKLPLRKSVVGGLSPVVSQCLIVRGENGRRLAETAIGSKEAVCGASKQPTVDCFKPLNI